MGRHGWAGALATLLALALVACAPSSARTPRVTDEVDGPAASPNADPVATTEPKRPDMVFVLMDDFSLELLATMPEALRMKRRGATYDNAFVVDSLCCPSRAALLTGQTPHQTGVLTNTPNDLDNPIGGFAAFTQHGNLGKQFAKTLQKNGYATGFTGKFMNEYESVDGRLPQRVPGWTEWAPVLGGGYNGWGFQELDGRRGKRLRAIRHNAPDRSVTGKRKVDEEYATNVISRRALDFIDRREKGKKPYFLMVAPYGPHSALDPVPGDPRFPPAMADRAPAGDPTGGNCGARDCGDLGLADLKGYDDPRGDNAPTYLRRDGTTAPAPAWRTNPIDLSADSALTYYRDRARMVQSIDRMIGRIRRAAGDDAYIVLTSDNGFHLGQHQLNGGKGAPYDSDTRVPLVVVGPDVKPGHRQQYVSNIDLAPTFEELAGVDTPRFRAGRSFARTLTRQRSAGARYVFSEHTYARIQPGEVDLDQGSGGTIDIIPSYIGVRSDRGLLVRFDLDNSWKGTDYAWELYTYRTHPWEDVNVFARLHDRPWVRDLMRRIRAFDGCGPAACRAAAD